jgi:hypothetical protein
MVAAPECRLEPEDLQAQLARYRLLGEYSTSVSREPCRVIAQFEADVPISLVERIVEVESRCCPFIHTAFEPDTHRLALAVERPEHDQRLDPLFSVLAPRSREIGSSR